MPIFQRPKETLKRLAKSCWPVRDCWRYAPQPGRITKPRGRQIPRHVTLRERRTGLARQLEQAHRLYEEMLDEKAGLQACNDAVVATAGKLDLVSLADGARDVERRLEERACAWESYKEAWRVLTDMHIDVVLALGKFETGPERLLLRRSSREAAEGFFVTMGEYAFVENRRVQGGSSIPGAEDEDIMSILRHFHERHLDGIVRALDLLPVDLEDVRRRTQTGRGDDGMTVQERYVASQNALLQTFPRKVAPLSDAAQEELDRLGVDANASLLKTSEAYGPWVRHRARGNYWKEYDRLLDSGEAQTDHDVAQLYLKESRRLFSAIAAPEAEFVKLRDQFMRLGGVPFNEEDGSPVPFDVDHELSPFSEHRADYEACGTLIQVEHDDEATPKREEDVWSWEERAVIPWRELVRIQRGRRHYGGSEESSSVELDQWEAKSVGMGASVFDHFHERTAMRTRALEVWKEECDKLRKDMDQTRRQRTLPL